MRSLVWILVMSAAACGHTGTSSDPPVNAQFANAHAEPPFVGNWIRDVGNGEYYVLHFFPSGIVAFTHADPKFPISRSYGRWRLENGAVELELVRTEPERERFPLATRLIAEGDATTLTLSAGGDRSTWKVHDTYGVSRDGWQERAAHDEASWSGMVERAERGAP